MIFEVDVSKLKSTVIDFAVDFEFVVNSDEPGHTEHEAIADPWMKIKAAVLSNYKPAIIPRNLFSFNHITVQSSGRGQLFFYAS
jgi:hypothetical protein